VGAFCDGIIDANCSSVDLHSGDGITGFPRVLDVLESDKAKSATATSFAVVDNRHLLDMTIAPENILQRFLPRSKTKVEDAQDFGFGRVISVAIMSSSTTGSGGS